MSTPRFKLVSFDGCPYVQRSRIVLEIKQVPYETVEIDLGNKPDWFLALNPRGKVPVLIVDGEKVVYESAVINELLEELLPEPRLLPADPWTRARARIWIEFANNHAMSAAAKLMFARSEEREEEARAELSRHLQTLEEELAQRPAAPYFLGPEFSLVDATWAPFFDRERVLHALWGWTPPQEEIPRVWAWAEACLAHPRVRATCLPDLEERYRPYRERQLAAR